MMKSIRKVQMITNDRVATWLAVIIEKHLEYTSAGSNSTASNHAQMILPEWVTSNLETIIWND